MREQEVKKECGKVQEEKEEINDNDGNEEKQRNNNKRLCTEAAPRKTKKRTPYIQSERDHIQRYRQTMLRQHIEMIYESNKNSLKFNR